MDCDKFDSILIDELYGELDEVTSAASKRHAAGCSKCATKLANLKRTREAVRPSLLEAPSSLEGKVMAAVREAEKVVPLRGSGGSVISLLGRWAMRPQTAMAALFLLMIGSSGLLIRSRSEPPRAAVAIQERGTPSPLEAQPHAPTADNESADKAHGLPKGAAAPPPAPAAEPVAVATSVAAGEQVAVAATPPPMPVARSKRAADDPPAAPEGRAGAGGPSNAGALGGAPHPHAAPARRPSMDVADPWRDEGSRAEAPMEEKKKDLKAPADDSSATLAGARAVRDANGCAAALGRFEAIASSASGTPAGHDAALEAAHCYRMLGQTENARQRYGTLLGVASHRQRAQEGMNALNAVATRKSQPAKPTPPATQTVPAQGTEPAASQKRAVEKGSGF